MSYKSPCIKESIFMEHLVVELLFVLFRKLRLHYNETVWWEIKNLEKKYRACPLRMGGGVQPTDNYISYCFDFKQHIFFFIRFPSCELLIENSQFQPLLKGSTYIYQVYLLACSKSKKIEINKINK